MARHTKIGLRLVRHRSERPLHKRLALHPFSFLVMLCIGALLVMSTLQARAENLEVTAKVSAPLPITGAFIIYPHDQQHVSTEVLTVEGTCPVDTYVALYRNAVFSGVGQCVSGAFRIQVSLSVGANELRARVYNITNDEGPTSPPVIVYYDQAIPKPQSLGSPPVSGTKPRPSQGALTVTADYLYQTYPIGVEFHWEVVVRGGVPPYRIAIHWGDGETSTIESRDSKMIILSHTYRTAGTFQPLIKATDQGGSIGILQLLAVVKEFPGIGATASGTSWLSNIQWYVLVMWPAYLIVVLMVICFWLGELEIVHRLSGNRRANT